MKKLIVSLSIVVLLIGFAVAKNKIGYSRPFQMGTPPPAPIHCFVRYAGTTRVCDNTKANVSEYPVVSVSKSISSFTIDPDGSVHPMTKSFMSGGPIQLSGGDCILINGSVTKFKTIHPNCVWQ